MSDFEYENLRRVGYDCGDMIGKAVFVPVCSRCFRFVKPNKVIYVNELCGLKKEPNAKCSRCGDTEMLFEGFF